MKTKEVKTVYSGATHTLDWEHIWSGGEKSVVRLYLNLEDPQQPEFVHADLVGPDGFLFPLTETAVKDVKQSFEDNAGSGYDFASEAKPIPEEAKGKL